MTQPELSLNPTQATLYVDHIPVPYAGQLEQDQQAGTEQASFRIPLRWRPLIQRIACDPRFGYGMQPSRFYAHAVSELLMHHARSLTGDEYYATVMQEIRELTEFAYVNDIQTRFEDLLGRIDKQGVQILEAGNEERAFNWLRRVTAFVSNQQQQDEHLGEIVAGMARKHPRLRMLVALVGKSQVYGMTKQFNAIQNFFAEDTK